MKTKSKLIMKLAFVGLPVALLFVAMVATKKETNRRWQKTFGGDKFDAGTSVQQTTDGGYIVTGETTSYGYGIDGPPDVYLIKTDASGNIQWQEAFGKIGSYMGFSVQQTTDKGYIVGGNIGRYGTNFPLRTYDIYLIKTDTSGNIQWQKTFGGDKDDFVESVQQTTDGGYIVTGYTTSYGYGIDSQSDVYLIKTDASGNIQ